MGQFSAGTINKALPSFRNSLTRVGYVKGDRRHSERFSLFKKLFILTVLAAMVGAVLNIDETIFDNVSTAKWP